MRPVLSRLPLRWKLTLVFGASLAVVLTAVGVFLYSRLAADLDLALERDLRARSAQISSLLMDLGASDLPQAATPVLEPDERFAQILRPDGSVVSASAHPEVRLLSDEQLSAASRGELLLDRPGDGAISESLRLLATPVRARDQKVIVLVSSSLDERNEALSTLWELEIVGLGAALAAACAVGYLVARSALRPVEQLRRRAADLTGERLTHRDPLPVSHLDDELGRLARTLNAMLNRIGDAQQSERDSVERERRFLAEASHQLRTPLAIIKGEVELAVSGPDDPAGLRAALVSTGQEADRLSALADQLLTVMAGGEQRLAVHREPLTIAPVLTAMADAQRRRAAADGRTIAVNAPPDLELDGDRFRLEQLVDCLLDNALLHGAGDIEVSAMRTATGARIVVRDGGRGFSGELAATAFERFRRDSRSTGAGLGLAIVQAIAEAHGGSARLGDGPGGCVVVDLPAGAQGQQRVVVSTGQS